MIAEITNFTMKMVCTIMVIIIIKMIVPDGKNKKYILFVCGMVSTLIVLEPLLNFLNFDINEVLAHNEVQYEEFKTDDELYQNAIQSSYEKSLTQDVINRLKENGYSVSNVKIEYDNHSYQPKKIYLNLEDQEGYVQPIKIEVSNNTTNSNISEIVQNNIKEIIKSNYGIEKNNILIERSK